MVYYDGEEICDETATRGENCMEWMVEIEWPERRRGKEDYLACRHM